MFVQLRSALIFLTILLLTACGGGGSSNNLSGTSDGPSSLSGTESVYASDSNRLLEQAKQVASSQPLTDGSSVTQSSNRITSGVTVDYAETSFDGANLIVKITKATGHEIILNTASDTEVSATYVSPISGHVGRERVLLASNANSDYAAYIVASWDNTDSTDYIAGGYWLFVTKNQSTQQVSGIEVGAFVDGPELLGTPTLPSGTATYSGRAGGLYTFHSGSSTTTPGTNQVGRYAAPLTLTANFAGQTISGCIGCGDFIRVAAVAESPNGDVVSFTDSVNAQMRFGSAVIIDGSFVGSDMTFTLNGVAATNTSGFWGGKFSTTPDADGDPRLVAGTNSGRFTFSDGSNGALVGAYYGVKQ